MSYGSAETFLTAKELLLSELAHRGVGPAEPVQLAEEARQADRPRLTNLLERVPVESHRRERVARLLDRREGLDRPSGVREPSDELNPVQPAREALSDENRGTETQHPANLAGGDAQVWEVVKDQRQPDGVGRSSCQREGAGSSGKHLDGRCPRDLLPHRRRRLDGQDAEVKPVAEGSGELTGPAPMSTSIIPCDGRR
jgi:hypothetical protein